MPKISRRDCSIILRFLFPGIAIRLNDGDPMCCAYLDGASEARFYADDWLTLARRAEIAKQQNQNPLLAS